MRNLLLIGVILSLMVMPVSAANHSKVVETAVTSANSTSLAVATTATIYTKSFPIKSVADDTDIGVAYVVTPATSDVGIWFEQSTQRPTTEGSSDVTYMITDVIKAVTTDGSWHLATVDSAELMYGRFKLVGASTNPATAVLTIKYVK